MGWVGPNQVRDLLLMVKFEIAYDVNLWMFFYAVDLNPAGVGRRGNGTTLTPFRAFGSLTFFFLSSANSESTTSF